MREACVWQSRCETKRPSSRAAGIMKCFGRTLSTPWDSKEPGDKHRLWRWNGLIRSLVIWPVTFRHNVLQVQWGMMRFMESHNHGTKWQPVSSWSIVFDDSFSYNYPFKPPKVAFMTRICKEFILQVLTVMAAFVLVFYHHSGLSFNYF